MTETIEAPPVVAAPQLDAIVAKYIALRDAKATRKKAYEADIETIDAAMDKCELYFRNTMLAQGLTSLPTKSGTPYMTEKTSVTVADPALYKAWIEADPSRWAFLDVKANKTAVVAYKEEHNDLPPGLNWRAEVAVNVRR